MQQRLTAALRILAAFFCQTQARPCSLSESWYVMGYRMQHQPRLTLIAFIVIVVLESATLTSTRPILPISLSTLPTAVSIHRPASCHTKIPFVPCRWASLWLQCTSSHTHRAVSRWRCNANQRRVKWSGTISLEQRAALRMFTLFPFFFPFVQRHFLPK